MRPATPRGGRVPPVVELPSTLTMFQPPSQGIADAELREAFEVIDKSGDGLLSADELRTAMKMSGVQPAQLEAQLKQLVPTLVPLAASSICPGEITATTKGKHELKDGLTITISGFDDRQLNGDRTVLRVLDDHSFVFAAAPRRENDGWSGIKSAVLLAASSNFSAVAPEPQADFLPALSGVPFFASKGINYQRFREQMLTFMHTGKSPSDEYEAAFDCIANLDVNASGDRIGPGDIDQVLVELGPKVVHDRFGGPVIASRLKALLNAHGGRIEKHQFVHLLSHKCGNAAGSSSASSGRASGVKNAYVLLKDMCMVYLMRRRAQEHGVNCLHNISEFALSRRAESFPHAQLRSGQLSRRIKLAYAAPAMTAQTPTMLLLVWGLSLYERVGASAAVIAVSIGVGRSLDFLLDSHVPWLTDSLRPGLAGIHGRRRPFIVLACVPMAVCQLLLFNPPTGAPGWVDSDTSVWFACTYVVYYICYTFFNIPYDALGSELTDCDDERDSLYQYCGAFEAIGNFFAVVVPVAISIALSTGVPCAAVESTCSSMLSNASSTSPLPAAGSVPGCFPGTSHDMRKNNTAYWPDHYYNASACRGGAGGEPAALAGVEAFCRCEAACYASCEILHEKTGVLVVSTFFALWHVASSLVCAFVIHERKHSQDELKITHVFGNLVSVLETKCSMVLLHCMTCDAFAYGIVWGNLSYFIRYVVKPEGSCGVVGGDQDNLWCKSSTWIALSMFSMVVAMAAFLPLWLQVIRKLGNRSSWMLFSAAQGLCTLMFYLVYEKMMVYTVVVCGLNGAVMGGKFLADAVMADVIDYNEFLTGSRLEATFTVLRSFLPKYSLIFAAAIPMAWMAAAGHVDAVDGQFQQQPRQVTNFVQNFMSLVPTLLAALSFWKKKTLPLGLQDSVALSEGIGRHRRGMLARDPIKGHIHGLTSYDDREQSFEDLLDYFPGVGPLESCLDDPTLGTWLLEQQAKIMLWIYAGLAFVLSLLVLFSVPMLADKRNSVWCVMVIVLFGLAISLVYFSVLRKRAASKLISDPPYEDTMRKILQARLEKIQGKDGVLGLDGSVTVSTDVEEEVQLVLEDASLALIRNLVTETHQLRLARGFEQLKNKLIVHVATAKASQSAAGGQAAAEAAAAAAKAKLPSEAWRRRLADATKGEEEVQMVLADTTTKEGMGGEDGGDDELGASSIAADKLNLNRDTTSESQGGDEGVSVKQKGGGHSSVGPGSPPPTGPPPLPPSSLTAVAPASTPNGFKSERAGPPLLPPLEPAASSTSKTVVHVERPARVTVDGLDSPTAGSSKRPVPFTLEAKKSSRPSSSDGSRPPALDEATAPATPPASVQREQRQQQQQQQQEQERSSSPAAEAEKQAVPPSASRTDRTGGKSPVSSSPAAAAAGPASVTPGRPRPDSPPPKSQSPSTQPGQHDSSPSPQNGFGFTVEPPRDKSSKTGMSSRQKRSVGRRPSTAEAGRRTSRGGLTIN